MAVTKTWDIVSMDSAPTEGSLSDVVNSYIGLQLVLRL